MGNFFFILFLLTCQHWRQQETHHRNNGQPRDDDPCNRGMSFSFLVIHISILAKNKQGNKV